MTNEQLFTEIQISLSKLESKLSSLEAAVKEIKGNNFTTYNTTITAEEWESAQRAFPVPGVDKLN